MSYSTLCEPTHSDLFIFPDVGCTLPPLSALMYQLVSFCWALSVMSPVTTTASIGALVNGPFFISFTASTIAATTWVVNISCAR